MTGRSMTAPPLVLSPSSILPLAASHCVSSRARKTSARFKNVYFFHFFFLIALILNCSSRGMSVVNLRCSFIWGAKPISQHKSGRIKWAFVFLDLLPAVCNIRACIFVWQWRCTIAVAFSTLPCADRSTWQAVPYRITLSKLTFPITLIHYWIRLYKEPIQYVAIEHIIK